MNNAQPPAKEKSRPLDPFRRAIVGGLGVLLPPLLTIVIILWVWNTVALYLLVPMEGMTRRILVNVYDDNILPAASKIDEEVDGIAKIDGEFYRRAGDARFVPADHYDIVERSLGSDSMPPTALEVYQAYVDRTFLQRHIVVPVFLCIFLLVLYLLGKFLAAGVGRFFWTQFERIINRLPVVRNVYSSVKQVTDFMFNEREVQYTRVVAIEYPRKGIWQIGFVTGDALMDVISAANEPMLAVFLPCSPMPFTGFTAIVKRSETLDLNISMEQALQYIVSCGVVLPPHQLSQAISLRQRPAFEEAPPIITGS